MSAAFWGIVVVVVAMHRWQASRADHDLARQAVALACARAGVQWLDQAVTLERWRWRRGYLVRQYRFEYVAPRAGDAVENAGDGTPLPPADTRYGARRSGQLETAQGRVQWLALDRVIDVAP